MMLCLTKIILFNFLLNFLDAAGYKTSPATVTVEFRKLGFGECITPGQCEFRAELCHTYQLDSKDCHKNQTKIFKGTFDIGVLKPMPYIKFDTEHLQKEFLVKASFTILKNAETLIVLKYSKEFIGTDSEKSDMFDITNNFQQLDYEISSKCKPNYYPQRNCSVYCKPVHNKYSCDLNGKKICNKNYRYDKESDDCLKDYCKTGSFRCKNNGKCVFKNGLFQCECTEFYYGTFCDYWGPCEVVKCLNNGKCHLSKSVHFLCLCDHGFYGKYCENGHSNEAKNPIKSTKKPNPKVIRTTTKTKTRMTTEEKKSTEMLEMLPVNQVNMARLKTPGETQFKNLWTVFITCGFIVVCLSGLFIVTYWIIRLKYFEKSQNKITDLSINNSYPTLPQLPVCVNLNKPRAFNHNVTVSSDLTPNWPQFANEDSTNSIFVSSTEVSVHPNNPNTEMDQIIDESTSSVEPTHGDINPIDATDQVTVNRNDEGTTTD